MFFCRPGSSLFVTTGVTLLAFSGGHWPPCELSPIDGVVDDSFGGAAGMTTKVSDLRASEALELTRR